MGNRAFFVEADATVDAPGAANAPMPIFCRHVATDGPVLDFVRDRLTIQAQALVWTPSRDANLHLLVDGHVPSVREGEAAVFLFPDSARDVRLASNTFVPARIGLGDSSELGVFPIRARLRGLRRRGATHSLDDPRLAGGLHNDEAMVGAHWLGPRAS
jgi:hypothetical protein